eukprot:4221532-Alexandrium_andersonii.AAC.1
MGPAVSQLSLHGLGADVPTHVAHGPERSARWRHRSDKNEHAREVPRGSLLALSQDRVKPQDKIVVQHGAHAPVGGYVTGSALAAADFSDVESGPAP